ncbi:transmembrane protein 33-like [Dreissena polymorpha]|uniref:transmembrane protein 33-like n=1 Tax=Dreissena polymorpha TaxID=45954 RepID=UPI0022652463|nr:transmembrane protein 33-like [Dreissena polymorpha]
MSDSGSNGTGGGESQQQQQQSPQGQQSVIRYMLSNKVEAALWLTRVFTVLCTVMFILPLFGGNPSTHFERVLLSAAATSALRLHQRLPNFQFSRAFMSLLFAEDSCHYLFFCIIFLNSYPITMVLVPLFLFALLHACNYTKNLLDVLGPTSMMFMRNLIAKLQLQQTNILRFIACSEIFLMPALIFMTFSGRATIFHPFVYYRFLSLRYASRRNPYCRTLFYELRMTVEFVCNKPQCPQFVRNICLKAIGFISRLAPQVAAQ